jgi:methionyl-tRNA formyltransferase
MHLEAMHADAVVMASFDQIVGHRALTVPRHGWLNVHPSFIPEYRGPEPVYWAIAEGSGETGITLHRAVAKVDAGPILAQARVPITRDDTAGSLARKLATTGIELLPDALAALLDGAEGVTPDMSRASYRTSVGHRSLAGAHSAEEALRLIRAGFPNMLPWAHIDGRDLYVSKARIVSDGAADPRKTLRFPDGALEIIAAAERCGCHHDLSDCPHRNTEVANV